MDLPKKLSRNFHLEDHGNDEAPVIAVLTQGGSVIRTASNGVHGARAASPVMIDETCDREYKPMMGTQSMLEISDIRHARALKPADPTLIHGPDTPPIWQYALGVAGDEVREAFLADGTWKGTLVVFEQQRGSGGAIGRAKAFCCCGARPCSAPVSDAMKIVERAAQLLSSSLERDPLIVAEPREGDWNQLLFHKHNHHIDGFDLDAIAGNTTALEKGAIMRAQYPDALWCDPLEYEERSASKGVMIFHLRYACRICRHLTIPAMTEAGVAEFDCWHSENGIPTCYPCPVCGAFDQGGICPHPRQGGRWFTMRDRYRKQGVVTTEYGPLRAPTCFEAPVDESLGRGPFRVPLAPPPPEPWPKTWQ